MKGSSGDKMRAERNRLYEEKSVLDGSVPREESAERTGSVTPVKKFRTFPLADEAWVEEVSQESIPSEDDVRFVKEFGDENEK